MSTSRLAEIIRVLFDEKNHVNPRQSQTVIKLTTNVRDGLNMADASYGAITTAPNNWDGSFYWDGSHTWDPTAIQYFGRTGLVS